MEFHPDDSDPQVLILVADKELDSYRSWDAIDDLERKLDEGARALLVDCSGLGYVSSIAVCTLIRLYKRVTDHSGAFRLAAVQPPLLKILTVTRLNSVLQMEPSLADARQSVGIRQIAAGQ